MPIRLLIADDHALMREGLRTMLEGFKDIRVIAEAKDGNEAVRLAMELSPQVILMDITMPVLDGIEATRRIVASAPGTKVVALTMHTDEALISEVKRAGAKAAVQKDGDIKSVVRAIRAAAKQKAAHPAEACTRVPAHLTVRECDILKLLARGRCTKEIAWDLKISPKTVETHKVHIIQKTGIRTIAGLTNYAHVHGLVPA